MRNLNRTVYLFFGMLVVVVGMACEGAKVQERIFGLEIREQALIQGESVLRVNQDDTVTIVVAADEHVFFHLHGYDITKEAKPGSPATLEFAATATGSFPFTIHAGEEAHDHDAASESCETALPSGVPVPTIQLTVSAGEKPGEIHATVDLENFTLGSAPESPELVHGHWHLFLDGELKGMYEHPEATVVVGDAGEYQVMATLTNSQHCSYGVNTMTTIVVEEGASGMGMDMSMEEKDEVELGRLEVQPR
jgi:hypothetical protein